MPKFPSKAKRDDYRREVEAPPTRPEHRYVYSSEDGDSCSCGWTPTHFRAGGGEWVQHASDASYLFAPRGPGPDAIDHGPHEHVFRCQDCGEIRE